MGQADCPSRRIAGRSSLLRQIIASIEKAAAVKPLPFFITYSAHTALDLIQNTLFQSRYLRLTDSNLT